MEIRTDGETYAACYGHPSKTLTLASEENLRHTAAARSHLAERAGIRFVYALSFRLGWLPTRTGTSFG